MSALPARSWTQHPRASQDNEDGGSGTSNFVFRPADILGSRISFGVRLVWFIMSFTFEGSFTLPHFDVPLNLVAGAPVEAPETIGTFNAKVSFFLLVHSLPVFRTPS